MTRPESTIYLCAALGLLVSGAFALFSLVHSDAVAFVVFLMASICCAYVMYLLEPP